MEVSFVNAGILTLERSVGLTFGANIGTTITSQLVSLKLTAVAPFIIFIGSAVLMFGKKPLLKKQRLFLVSVHYSLELTL